MPKNGDKRRVLVVDDEPSILDSVATSLRYEGYEVEEAMTGRAALASALKEAPDLIVLDIMLPDVNGLEVTRQLRSSGVRAPILFLTARDSVEDKVAGLTIGGDDYVTKPFALAEIIARVQAIMRRSLGDATDERLRFSDVEMDERAHEVRRAGHLLELTATEYNLLRFFLSNPRRVLSKAQILDHVWHYDFGGDANVVETYVSYLRKKLERYGPALIHTHPPGRLHATRTRVGLLRCRYVPACCSPSSWSPSWRWWSLTPSPTRRCDRFSLARATNRWRPTM